MCTIHKIILISLSSRGMASAKSPCVSTVSLVSKVKASVQTVNAVSTIPGEDSMMSASDDK